MDRSATEPRSGGLAPWILLPLAALVIVFAVAFNLPSADCEGTGGPSGGDEALLILLAGIASAACIAGAIVRLVRLGRSGRDIAAEFGIAGIGVAVALVLVSILFDPESGFDLSWLAWVLGLVGTGMALIALGVAWLARRRVDDVGSLVPLYLFGAAIFAYPGVTLLGLFVASGYGC